ncbi:hypothetical protein PTSG_10457 [Salpingoeca rosetta]|uniref:Uncharacterized protein n=1 Tax=Salpingoeca rosetta (strain ATCC 50818 / BSB-021) TaxID=946362 RepID=F2UPQ3_SALR5|nr:uncharacterized protein PTSG_10457 [Salpingoeca rosetta]EGD79608.1 hypothetical protein PTSG_10457 [Salpingoeca rosetta]|eukprot:XP_004988836.1 hypothetical protein PTSG_10457 [Salpingoeca rosetta]
MRTTAAVVAFVIALTLAVAAHGAHVEPPRPNGKRTSLSGAACMSTCRVRPHTLELIAEEQEAAAAAAPMGGQTSSRFGTFEDLLMGLSNFATCVVDPSLSPSSGASFNNRFAFAAHSASHKPFFTTRTVTVGPGSDSSSDKHVFFVSSTPNCPVCVEHSDHATAATHDPSTPYAHRCNGTCLDLCTPQWAAFDAFVMEQKQQFQFKNVFNTTSDGADASLRRRRDIGDFFDDVTDTLDDAFNDVIDTVGGAFQDAVDDLQEAFVDLSDDIVETIGEQFNALSEHLQDIVRGVTSITEASLEDLSALGQDILGHLRAVGDMTIAQIGHIAQRLVDFAEENLRNFINMIDPSVFESTLQDFGCERRWAPSQATMFITRAVDVVGAVTGWDVDRFREMGSLIRGLARGDIENLEPLLIDSAVLIASGITGIPPDTVEALAERVVDIVGLVSTWNSTDFRAIGNVASGLADGDLQVLADSSHLNALARVAFDVDLNRITTIASRGIDLIGGASSDNEEGWQQVAQFASGIAADHLENMGETGIRALGRLPDTGLDPARLNMLLDRVVEVVGMPSQWDDGAWDDLGLLAVNFATDALRNISMTGLQTLGTVLDIPFDTAEMLLGEAIDQLGPITEWSTEDFGVVGNILKAIGVDVVADLNEDALMFLVDIADQLPHDVLSAVLERFMALRGVQLEEFALDLLEQLQPALAAIPSETIRRLPAEAIMLVDSIHDLSHNQVEALLARAVELFGPVENWSATTWQAFPEHAADFAAMSLSDLTPSSLSALGNDPLATFSNAALMTLGPRITELLGSVDSLTPQQLSDLGDMLKALAPQDLMHMTTDLIPFLRDVVPGVLDEAVCLLDFACDDSLGLPLQDLPLCNEQLQVIGLRLRELLGEVSTWNASVRASVGPLAISLSPADMGQLPTDALTDIASVNCLGDSLVECIVKRAMNLLGSGDSIASWTSSELRMLGNAIRGLDAAALRGLSASVVVDALDNFVSVQWNSDQLAALADQLIEALGDTADWSADMVDRAGAIIAGLDDIDLAAIPARALRRISDEVFTLLCENQKLHVMTPDQLAVVASLRTSLDCPVEEGLLTSAQSSAVTEVTNNGGDSNGSGSGSVSSGTVAAAVIVPIVLIALIVAGVFYYRNKSGSGSSSSGRPKSGSVQRRVKDIELQNQTTA